MKIFGVFQIYCTLKTGDVFTSIYHRRAIKRIWRVGGFFYSRIMGAESAVRFIVNNSMCSRRIFPEIYQIGVGIEILHCKNPKVYVHQMKTQMVFHCVLNSLLSFLQLDTIGGFQALCICVQAILNFVDFVMLPLGFCTRHQGHNLP